MCEQIATSRRSCIYRVWKLSELPVREVLGVIVNDRLSATDHVNNLLSSCSSLLYALRMLRSRDIPAASPYDVSSRRLRTARRSPCMVWCFLGSRLRQTRFFAKSLQTSWLLWLNCTDDYLDFQQSWQLTIGNIMENVTTCFILTVLPWETS